MWIFSIVLSPAHPRVLVYFFSNRREYTKVEKIPTDFTARHMPQANADLFPLVPKLVLHKYVYFSGENPAFTSPSFFLLVLSELKTVRVF